MTNKVATPAVIDTLLAVPCLPPVVRQRLEVVRLAACGMAVEEITRHHDLARSLCASWIERAASQGVGALLTEEDSNGATDEPGEDGGEAMPPPPDPVLQDACEDACRTVFQARVRARRQPVFAGALGWIVDDPDAKGFWEEPFRRPYLEGAMRRAEELGHRIDVIEMPSLVDLDTLPRERADYRERLQRILYHRGIVGVILPELNHTSLTVSPWPGISTVHLGTTQGRLAAIRAQCPLPFPVEASHHEAFANYFENFRIAWRELSARGVQRIGTVLHQYSDLVSSFQYRAAMHIEQDQQPPHEHIPLHLIPDHPNEEDARKLEAWFRKWRPEVIITRHNRLCELLTSRGLRVPEDVGVVHLAVTSEIAAWAGIREREADLGAAVVDLLVARLQRKDHEAAVVPMRITLTGEWTDGSTLIAPSPATERLTIAHPE